MNRKLKVLIAILLIATLILSACGKPSTEPANKSTSGASQDPPPSASKSDPTPNTTETPPETPAPTEPTDSEIALFNNLTGGFFYTQSDSAEHQEARQAAITTLNEQVSQLLQQCLTLKDRVTLYEEKVLRIIDDVEKTEYDGDFQYLINQMAKYSTAIQTLATKATSFDEINNDYSPHDVHKAIISKEVFEDTVGLYQMLDEYSTYLTLYSEYIASGIVLDYNDTYDEIIRKYTNPTLENEVVPALVSATKSYLIMSNIYAHIASADYYQSLVVREQTLAKLANMEQNEEVISLQEILQQEVPAPDFLVEPVPESNKSTFKPPFIITAYANELENHAMSLNILREVDILLKKQSSGDSVSDKDINTALTNIVLDHNAQIKNLTKNFSKEMDTAIDTINACVVYQQEQREKYAAAERTKNSIRFLTYATHYAVTNEKHDEEDTTTNPKQENTPLDMTIASKNIQAVEKEIISEEQRQMLIKKIKEAQNSGTGLLGGLLSYTKRGGSFVYIRVIANFTEILAENKDKMKGETYQELHDVLNIKLGEILGEHKAAFANKFLNDSAEEMVNKFTTWLNNSNNRINIKLNLNTLIDLLDAIGFKHEAEKEEEVAVKNPKSEDKSNQDQQTITNPVPPNNENDVGDLAETELPETVYGGRYTAIATPYDVAGLNGNMSESELCSVIFGKGIPHKAKKDVNKSVVEYKLFSSNDDYFILRFKYADNERATHIVSMQTYDRDLVTYGDDTCYSAELTFHREDAQPTGYRSYISRSTRTYINGYYAKYSNGILVEDWHGAKGYHDAPLYWYHNTGELRLVKTVTYEGNEALINAKSYHVNGTMTSEYNYKKEFNEKTLHVHLSRPAKHGPYWEYTNDGSISKRGQYANDEPVGMHESYFNGYKSSETYYNDKGERVKVIRFKEDGSVGEVKTY